MSFAPGDKVTCSATHSYDGVSLASFVRQNTYEVIQVGGKNLPDDRIVIGINGAVTAAVKAETLTLVGGGTPIQPVTPEETPPANPPKENINADDVMANVMNRVSTGGGYRTSGARSGGGVQLPEGKTQSMMTSDVSYNAGGARYSDTKSNSHQAFAAVEQQAPSIIQNTAKFPPVKSFDSGKYRYDYYMDYERDGLMGGLHVGRDDGIRKSLNIDIMSRRQLFLNYTEAYNKFKLANPNDMLSKSFAHVFFVRPDCNIFEGPWMGGQLAGNLKTLSEFYYALKHSPELLRQLTQSNAGYGHELMLYLSNKASSFELSDEVIEIDTYGNSMTGYKVPYGKHDVGSKTSGTFNITYYDDRDLHIYHLHRLWLNYISYVYRGKVSPLSEYIINKVIDYATCVYYILTAEDGETIIFWSKYWGVFPTNAPSSAYSYTIGNSGGIDNPEIHVQYQYAWKEDFNPLTLIEFNTHTRNLGFSYVPNYQASKLGTGYTWAGSPFIETISNPNSMEMPYTFKLRFRKK